MMLSLLLVACGVDEPLNNNDEPELSFGREGSLEIVTWDISNFPKMGTETIDYLVSFLNDIDSDIICFQGIEDSLSFNILASQLINWDGIRANNSHNNINLAILYKNYENFYINSVNEIFLNDDIHFPRPPFQIEFNWLGEDFVVINNQLSGLSGYENEQYRAEACTILANYVKTNFNNENVVITGNFNSEIDESNENSVFKVFLYDPENFMLTDYDIAVGPSENWSWNNGASHLDHIIISNELYDEYSDAESTTQTLRVDDYINGGWDEYSELIADHSPVALRLAYYNDNALTIGSDETLEIVTWNIESFPKLENETIDLVVQLINEMDADIICLQEIEDNAAFIELDSQLTNWDGFRGSGAAYSINLAVLYKNSVDFQLESIEELFTDDWYAFPRSPIQLEFLWNNETFYVITNHLKAMGQEDDIERRRQACEGLAEYVLTELPDENVIITGDLNDLIIDPPDTNVYNVFLQDPDNFIFADYDIAYGSALYWSWNNGSSHLDHIIISNELFDEFTNPQSSIQTIRIDDYLDGGWSFYDDFISDHRPVALTLHF